MLDARIPTNSASRHDANAIVRTPKKSRIPLGIVSVFARRMLAYERLERWRASSPRASSRRLASTSVSPVRAISATLDIRRH